MEEHSQAPKETNDSETASTALCGALLLLLIKPNPPPSRHTAVGSQASAHARKRETVEASHSVPIRPTGWTEEPWCCAAYSGRNSPIAWTIGQVGGDHDERFVSGSDCR